MCLLTCFAMTAAQFSKEQAKQVAEQFLKKKVGKVQISYVGSKTVTTKFTEPEENLVIEMEEDDILLGGVFIKEWMHDADADIYEMR